MSVAPGLQPESWHLLTLLDRAPGLHALADTLGDLVDEGHPIVAGTADLKYSNGLVRFQDRHPDRYVQFGISEQHMVSTAAGLATTGWQPHVATFASFLALLACEQIRTDVAYTKLPVRLIGHHAGITLGYYGTSHHATEDLAITRSIAGLTVIAPADAAQLRSALRAATTWPGPIYFRIGRGQDPDVYDRGDREFTIGRAIEHSAGGDLTIIATGSMVHPALSAAAALSAEGISAGVLDMHTVKPLDADAVAKAAARSGVILTVEEHSILGGLGGAVAEVVAEQGLPARVVRHGLRDEYALIGPPTHLYRHYGLDADGIARAARAALG
ncbi:transketolase [Amycolatopsis deserti]|uniref:Transketolase n=1 Tax=Amycolatopsis deserti TaxID=185696 RepID=A0ABQ3IHB8_9PSEU|nr:transketolase C-terminal domain-containing protein [Amycolatopsis deserti]GHE78879.1 transketolase [Amycolatopsis deserti]